MKSINPLFLLCCTIVVFAIALFSFNKAQQTLQQEATRYHSYKVLASKYNDQKIYFSDQKAIVAKLQKFIKVSKITNGKITQQKKKIIFTGSKLDAVSIEKFMNKILNEQFNITNLQLTKDSIKLDIGIQR